ncbi:uncharacterized protein LOC111643392 [Copidosoma floridanum]|uniref:uncharacterized protein LOC111643392 n=1 Tax=Copidosoma floridanum TaxID=29053 RepID=UPI000C6F7F78|nr:uncharacterized protein LOC111643392 [Copidosoma floridanum]XP_023246924.1 uncharacterized protein LOC111643392 [Copidosoma floridanum]
MVCVCPSGYISSGSGTCEIISSIFRVECKSDSDCPSERSCVNAICKDPCACGTNAICNIIDHKPICSCITGFDGNPDVECIPVGRCRSNHECPGTHACLQHNCVLVCSPSLKTCGKDAECNGFNHRAVCECPPGYTDNPTVACVPIIGCRKNSDCPSTEACINEKCKNPCLTENPCERNAECSVYNHVVECACPSGYIDTKISSCIPVGCKSDDECPLQQACVNRKCVNPCNEIRPCGINAICTVLDTHPVKTMTCDCLPDYRGNAVEQCEPICQLEKGQIRNQYGECVCPPNHAKNDKEICIPCYPEAGVMIDENGICRAKKIEDFKKSMSVKCLSDGVLVTLVGQGEAFNGIIYVKYYSSDEQCRRDLIFPKEKIVIEEFKVTFGTCGLTHVNGVASFTLVIQRHKKLMTYNAQAYSIKCLYQIGEQNITLGFNVSMMTTAGTIANTGPPPTCRMKIVSQSGNEISQAEIGDGLKLEVDVSPTSIYGGFARSCVAKTTDDGVENEYVVTDENGCATDPTIFGEWEQDTETQTLMANFNAFKFPSSDNIRFQCNIRVCFGRCQPVNCRGYNAFGRRRRDTSSANNSSRNLPENVIGDERGNINVTSNMIVTIDRRDDKYSLYQPNDPAPRLSEDDVCVSMVGFVVSLIITTLLALVAVAIAVSCWLMAYRRQPKTAGPLPHPPEFPNPLFTTESVAEPSPDYYLS